MPTAHNKFHIDIANHTRVNSGVIEYKYDAVHQELHYEYMMKDHLGNSRMLLRGEPSDAVSYSSCDFENSSQPVNVREYLKADYERYPTPAAFNYSQGTNETCQMLKDYKEPVGVGKLLKVMATDDLRVSVDYYIPGVANPTSANANGLQSLVQAVVWILNNTEYSGAMHGEGVMVGDNLQHDVPLQSLMEEQSPANTTNPVKAYLNVLFFDEEFNFVCNQSQFYPLNIVGSAQHFYLLGGNSITVPGNGYVYILCEQRK